MLVKAAKRLGGKDELLKKRRRRRKTHALKDEWKSYKRLKTKVKVGFQNI